MFRSALLLLVAGVLATSGCFGTDERAPATPSAVPEPVPGPVAFHLEDTGDLGQRVWVCAYPVCTPSPALRASDNFRLLPLVGGTLRSVHVEVSWSPETPLTQTLGLFVGTLDPECTESCGMAPVAASGASPLVVTVEGDALGHAELTAEAALFVAVVSDTRVQGLVAGATIEGGQAFHVVVDAVVAPAPIA